MQANFFSFFSQKIKKQTNNQCPLQLNNKKTEQTYCVPPNFAQLWDITAADL